MKDDSQLLIRVKLIGVGNGGNLAVEFMAGKCLMTSNWPGVELICIDTAADGQIVGSTHHTTRLGVDTGERACTTLEERWTPEQVAQNIRNAINGAHMVFITVVMGGNSGSGSAPVIARLAREMGMLTVVAVIVQPFGIEEVRSMSCADTDSSLAELESSADAVIVMHYAKLLELLGRDPAPNPALTQANIMLTALVRDMVLTVNVPGYVGVDFEDVRTVLGQAGKALIGSGLARGPNRGQVAVEQALMSPFFNGANLMDVDRVLVLVSGAEGGFKLSDCKLAMNAIRSRAFPEAHVIYGTTFDNELGNSVRVTVIATGLRCRDA